ncbi:MAG: DEAD/DEAH box helicase [Candidatus Aenigmarchaeota archaeon]|nr:DEAD/DEAH box helicase [Candidatus Aenigmarchaeota archaeon]
MHIEDLPFPQRVVDIIRKEAQEFNPVQKASIPHVLEGSNLVVASPTASGKTLVAEIAVLKNYIEGGKSVYVVPLKALASEKYQDFRQKYPFMRTAISIGDLDSAEQWLGSYDLVIASNEKMDSLLRHNSPWLKDISLLVIDEIHMLNDPTRGPTLEVVITRMKNVKQIIALSATIQNAEELTKWLDAKLVRSDYRPVKLEKGVAYPKKDKMIVDMDDSGFELPYHEHALIHDTVKKSKQCLLFVSTRKSAEASAEKANLSALLSAEEKIALAKIAKEAENVLSIPTKQCKRLGICIRQGAAFHHAGLVAKQRKIVEDAFRNGKIKMISSTPTLSFGLNLPAYRVLIRDTKRFDANYGNAYIPVMDVHQMCGRAGRPKYDSEGQAILLAKSENEAEDLKDRYLFAEPEPIYSKLGMEQVLRMHVLALIASEIVKNKSELRTFFAKTFFAHQYRDIDAVMEKVEKVLELLENYKFIKIGEQELYQGFKTAFDVTGDPQLRATRVGKRISELYIDPASAFTLIQNLKHLTELEALMVINDCAEMYPLLNARKKDYEDLEDALAKSGLQAPDVWSYDYEEFMDRFKTTLIFIDWINEKGEDVLLEKFGIAPGELYSKTLSAEWLLYAVAELAVLLNKKDVANHFSKLRLRVKHGVREELLRLIKLKGIGRARARKLYNAGIRNFADVKKSVPKVEELLGKKVAQGLLSQEDLDEKIRAVKRRR